MNTGGLALGLLASALLLGTASPTPTNLQQAEPQPQTRKARATPSPSAIPNRIITAEIRQPTATPESHAAANQTKHSPQQPFEVWLLWILARMWEIDWSNWALFAVAIWAGRAAWRTVGEMRSQAAKQTLDFDRSFAETREATQAATRQAKVSEDTLILTQRPRLIVRNVVVKRSENTIPPRPLFERGMPVSGQFYISNVGGTPARIIEIGCWVEWYIGELPMERPYEGRNGDRLSTPIVLQPSQSTPWPFTSEQNMGDEANSVLLNNDRWGICVLGWVAYKDDAEIERRTAFCRRWSVDRQRFMPVADTDYQHEE